MGAHLEWRNTLNEWLLFFFTFPQHHLELFSELLSSASRTDHHEIQSLITSRYLP